ncbi:MAG TPA: DinB family protein [Candidatus Deferrimicrobium sp.]|nr:DinB family protein [Candidatus Deferrimicrobium sp.]
MSQEISHAQFTKSLFSLFDETFEKVEGLYLDEGTSLFETLNTVSADQASRPIVTGGTTIAAHVEHTRFYLHVLKDYIQGKWHEKVDWKESWKIRSVTVQEWESLRQQLRQAYDNVSNLVRGIDDWNDEHKIGGALGILAHTAYHLGAVRQIVRVVKE